MTGHPGQESHDSSNPPSGVSDPFVRLGEGDYHSRLAAAPGISAVLFTSPHCGTCRAWKRLLPLALNGIAERFFEVDVSEATGIARYYGLFHLPAIYLYRAGHFHATLQCAAAAPAIRASATSLLAAPGQDEP